MEDRAVSVEQVYRCDYCGRWAKCATAKWSAGRDYYADVLHACPRKVCQEWLRKYANESGLEVVACQTLA